ncbi:MAG: hypothetical protein FWD17_01905, partial [Polyangiaceae bacterium]|nr:hypothetical protein [Polyangiaceae bacterium]
MRWAIVLLLTLVLAGLWVLVYFEPDLRWFAEFLTAGVVLVALLLVAVPLFLDWRKRVSAEREAKSAGDEAGDPKWREAFRAQVRRALADLARVRGGHRAARRLPCYLALGLPEAGTPALLRAWGLASVPSLGLPSPAPSITDGPAAYELWCSQEAVVLAWEIRVENVDRQHEAWALLLDEVRRARRERPATGVLVVAGLRELSVRGDSIAQAAGQMRKQVERVVERLGLALPVYVLLTHADAIPGFAEFWSDLSGSDDTSWGASFAPDDDNTRRAVGRAVERELETLAQALYARLVDRIAREPDAAKRLRVLGFPLAFRRAASSIAHFVELLAHPGAAVEQSALRGFYLVNAEGELPDAAFRPGVTLAADREGSGARPTFARDVLRSVILPDRHLATKTGSARERRSRWEVAGALLAAAFALIVLVPALASYMHNVDLAGVVRAAGRDLNASGSATSPGMPGDSIEAALDALKRCRSDARGWAVAGWFVPRAARQLEPPLLDAYIRRLDAWMLARLRPELERELDSVASAHALADAPSAVDDETPMSHAYDLVKLYATLTDPVAHGAGDWPAAHLAALWRHVLGDGALSHARLAEHARLYLDALAADPRRAWPARASFVTGRDRLRKLDVRDMPYRRVLLAAKTVAPLRASGIFSPASLEFVASRGDVQVPGAFTASGWEKIREALRGAAPLPSAAIGERWVLEDASLPQDDASLRRQVGQTYFEEYTRRWMSFLDELRVKTPTDVASATNELSAFKQGDGFYRILFEAFKQNTIREVDSSAAAADAGGLLARLSWFKKDADAGAGPMAPTPVELGFRPVLAFAGYVNGEAPGTSSLDKYLAILDKLKAALEAS